MIAPKTSRTEDAVVAEVVIAAPRKLVWAALTEPTMLAAWWGSPDMYRAEKWELDLRPGGTWICNGVSVDGSTFHVGGEVIDVSPIDRLVMTWKPSWDPTPPTRITYELTDDGAGTRLRMTHEGFTGYAESRDGHSQGWVRVLSWLGEWVEARAGES